MARGAIDAHRHRAEELFEVWPGLRKLVSQVALDLVDDSLREDQSEKTDLAQDQDRVAGAGPRHKAGDENVSIEANCDRLSPPGWGHQGLSATASGPAASAPFPRQAAERSGTAG